MYLKRFSIGLLVAALGVATVANHVPVPLSSVFGAEILTHLVYLAGPGNAGVPAYSVGGEDAVVRLHDGDSFSVMDGDGVVQTVVFGAADFADIAQATQDEVAAVLDARLDLAQAAVDNGHLRLRGAVGGAHGSLTLTDGQGSPLATLGFVPGTVRGSGAVELALSIPLDPGPHPDNHTGGGLAHHPYVVLASRTLGSTEVGGRRLPLAVDALTEQVLRATRMDLLPGFSGELDANEDARAVLGGDLLEVLVPSGPIHLAYLVLSETLDEVLFVSNVFTVEVGG